MYICNYCKRNFKEKYELCPACGGNSFSEKAYLGATIIETPPKDGYKLDLSNFEEEKKRVRHSARIGFIFSFVWFIMTFPILLFGFLSFGIGDYTVIIIGIFDALIIIAVLIYSIFYKISSLKFINSEVARIKKLSKKGLLVKGLSYKLDNTGEHIMGKYLHYYIEVTYENANGSKIPLTSEIKHDVLNKKFETVDLLIDPDDYSNYYIDYEIY